MENLSTRTIYISLRSLIHTSLTLISKFIIITSVLNSSPVFPYSGLESSDIDAIFVANGSPKPKCVKMFPSKTERSSSGLIEFETLNDALEGLVVCNHQPIPNPNGKFPYIMKLCFSRKVKPYSDPQRLLELCTIQEKSRYLQLCTIQ